MRQMLIAQGTNIEAHDEAGWTSLMRASFHGHLPVVEVLYDLQSIILDVLSGIHYLTKTCA